MVIQAAFCGGNSRKVATPWRLLFFFAILALGMQSLIFAQTKPERQSKAAKPVQSSSSPTASASGQNATAESDSSKPEDKLFKGMKYRMIGPFRGGRSLTAAGIPGDPTTYYFGATGGGVWKSTDGAMTWSPIFDKEGSGSNWQPGSRQFGSQHDLCRNRRGLYSRKHFPGRWSLQISRWRQDLEEHWSARYPRHRQSDHQSE